MALAIARMVMLVELFARDVPIAIDVVPKSAFLADVFWFAAHEGIAKAYNSFGFYSNGADHADRKKYRVSILGRNNVKRTRDRSYERTSLHER
jgi:hypothetical protein